MEPQRVWMLFLIQAEDSFHAGDTELFILQSHFMIIFSFLFSIIAALFMHFKLFPLPPFWFIIIFLRF